MRRASENVFRSLAISCAALSAFAIVALQPARAAADDSALPQTAPVWLIAPKDPAPSRPRPPTYFEEHSARVNRDILKFQHGYTLDMMRERDTLELYGVTPGTSSSTALGIGVFSTVVVAAAHAPDPLRFAFDRKFHLGPAIFDGGGMGAGFGGHL